jgi:hypothetical protein
MTEHSERFELSHAATDRPTIVVVPERRLFAIDGVGGPGGADYLLAGETLHRVGRILHDRLRRERRIVGLPPILETAWWTHPEPEPDDLPAAFEDRSTWHWQQMVELPDLADDADAGAAISGVQREMGRAEPLLRVITLTEGRSAQMLHLGGSASLAATLKALFDLLASDGLRPHGHVHELRLADERAVPADRVRSILRVPIED